MHYLHAFLFCELGSGTGVFSMAHCYLWWWISKLQSQQTAYRAIKFFKRCSGKDEDELTSSFMDYCLGSPRLITDFAKVLKNEWKIRSSAQFSYLLAISDLIDFQKAYQASADAFKEL